MTRGWGVGTDIDILKGVDGFARLGADYLGLL